MITVWPRVHQSGRISRANSLEVISDEAVKNYHVKQPASLTGCETFEARSSLDSLFLFPVFPTSTPFCFATGQFSLTVARVCFVARLLAIRQETCCIAIAFDKESSALFLHYVSDNAFVSLPLCFGVLRPDKQCLRMGSKRDEKCVIDRYTRDAFRATNVAKTLLNICIITPYGKFVERKITIYRVLRLLRFNTPRRYKREERRFYVCFEEISRSCNE